MCVRTENVYIYWPCWIAVDRSFGGWVFVYVYGVSGMTQNAGTDLRPKNQTQRHADEEKKNVHNWVKLWPLCDFVQFIHIIIFIWTVPFSTYIRHSCINHSETHVHSSDQQQQQICGIRLQKWKHFSQRTHTHRHGKYLGCGMWIFQQWQKMIII